MCSIGIQLSVTTISASSSTAATPVGPIYLRRAPQAKERDCPFRGRLPASGAVRSVSWDDHDHRNRCIDEHPRSQRAGEYGARVEVRPKRPLIRLAGAERRMPVHHMLSKIVIPAQEGLTHPEPNMLARVWTRTTRAEARVNVEALRIF